MEASVLAFPAGGTSPPNGENRPAEHPLADDPFRFLGLFDHIYKYGESIIYHRNNKGFRDRVATWNLEKGSCPAESRRECENDTEIFWRMARVGSESPIDPGGRH